MFEVFVKEVDTLKKKVEKKFDKDCYQLKKIHALSYKKLENNWNIFFLQQLLKIIYMAQLR